jgi:hypothetical protein
MNEIKSFTIPGEVKGEFVSCSFSAKGDLIYGLTNNEILLCYELNSGQLKKQIQAKVD